jgi:hypothetical protein
LEATISQPSSTSVVPKDMLKVFKALQAMLLQQSQANEGLLKSLD